VSEVMHLPDDGSNRFFNYWDYLPFALHEIRYKVDLREPSLNWFDDAEPGCFRGAQL